MFQTSAVAASVLKVQAPPAHLSGAPRLEGSDGSAPSIGAGYTGHKHSTLPPGGPPEDPTRKTANQTNASATDIDVKRKGEFLIDSAALRAANGRSRGSMKCEVEQFERGSDLTIKDWINQMKTYFTIGQVPPEAFVCFMLMKIVPRHLTEIKQYQSLNYLALREKLVKIFEETNMATAYLNALSNLSQFRDESISDSMNRARLLVLKAHPDLGHVPRERILVTSFLLGLYDRQLAASLAVVKIKTAADAERLAAEGEAVRQNQRFRRSNNNFLYKGPCVGDIDNSPDADLEPLDEDKE